MAKKASKSSSTTASDSQKLVITQQFEPLIATLKTQLTPLPEPQQFNHCIDVFSKWQGKHFYIMQKYKAGTNAITEFFDVGLARMEYQGVDKFKLAYFRHTGQWAIISEYMSSKDCQEMILDGGMFSVF
jgi:hypothetical protein